ncbi:hypothetical protein SAMCFNEI73_pB0371 (plasmid) [Sinorhizobium americanum]|uniref:Uncharacterized protein n=1 Tax=Sinorhizobium americanum TaxID=194963 RepID=A0A1L3LU17_9HYPH|nr:hypothetical protein SAMCFNEI73_pB0371 [Sinorhizobium americanum]
MDDFGFRLGKRLAHLGRQNAREIVAVFEDQLVPLLQGIGALARGETRPTFSRGVSPVDRYGDIRYLHVGKLCQKFTGGGVQSVRRRLWW